MTPTLIFLGVSLYIGMIAMVWAYVDRDTSTGVFTEDGKKMWLPGDPTNVLHFIDDGMDMTLCRKEHRKDTKNIKDLTDYKSVESLIKTTDKNTLYCKTCVKALRKAKKCTRKEKRTLLKVNGRGDEPQRLDSIVMTNHLAGPQQPALNTRPGRDSQDHGPEDL